MKQLPVFFADSQQRVWSGRQEWAECACEPGAYDPYACFFSLVFNLYMKINIKTSNVLLLKHIKDKQKRPISNTTLLISVNFFTQIVMLIIFIMKKIRIMHLKKMIWISLKKRFYKNITMFCLLIEFFFLDTWCCVYKNIYMKDNLKLHLKLNYDICNKKYLFIYVYIYYKFV